MNTTPPNGTLAVAFNHEPMVNQDPRLIVVDWEIIHRGNVPNTHLLNFMSMAARNGNPVMIVTGSPETASLIQQEEAARIREQRSRNPGYLPSDEAQIQALLAARVAERIATEVKGSAEIFATQSAQIRQSLMLYSRLMGYELPAFEIGNKATLRAALEADLPDRRKAYVVMGPSAQELYPANQYIEHKYFEYTDSSGHIENLTYYLGQLNQFGELAPQPKAIPVLQPSVPEQKLLAISDFDGVMRDESDGSFSLEHLEFMSDWAKAGNRVIMATTGSPDFKELIEAEAARHSHIDVTAFEYIILADTDKSIKDPAFAGLVAEVLFEDYPKPAYVEYKIHGWFPAPGMLVRTSYAELRHKYLTEAQPASATQSPANLPAPVVR